MAKKKRGLVDRLMLGKEKSEEYARGTLPSNRWELFWDIFKGRFGKLVIINLLTLIFCIPLFLVFFMRYVATINLGSTYPFAQPFGVGYMSPNSMAGIAESITTQVNLICFLGLPIAIVIMAIGISGAAYVMRNMVWTEGIFVANDFWKGVKENFKQILVIGMVYSLVFYVTVMGISISNQNRAVGSDMDWLYIIIEIFSYLVLIVFTIMTMHMITMSVTYDLKFRHLLKNSLLFTIALAPQNFLFILLGMIPFALLLLGDFFLIIGILAVGLLGISLILLIWTNFSQWAYDKFLNDKVPGAQKNRGIYEKVKTSNAGALKKYKEQLLLSQHNSLNSRPIKPITDEELRVADLPANFSRDDLIKLSESKQAIYDDHAKYVEEHKDDPEFQLTDEEQKLKDKQSDRDKRIEKAKKELAKRKYK